MSLLSLLAGVDVVGAGTGSNSNGDSFQHMFNKTVLAYALSKNKTVAQLARSTKVALYGMSKLHSCLEAGSWTVEGIREATGVVVGEDINKAANELMAWSQAHLEANKTETKKDRQVIEGYISKPGASTYVVNCDNAMKDRAYVEKLKAEIESEE